MAGRPREFDRDLALRQAQLLFWDRGFEGVSMNDLVAATGLASARLYAAFGSKEALFRETIELYERSEGGFADRALAEEPTVGGFIARMLRDAVAVYTAPQPRGCMVVSAATNCSATNAGIRAWLEQHRKQRTQSIIDRIRTAVADGELTPDTDPVAIGDAYATLLHGLAVQARDGVPADRLLAMITPATAMLTNAVAG